MMEDLTTEVLSEPDSQGRAIVIRRWRDPEGRFIPELHPDGQPVGLRRGQVFLEKLESGKESR